MLNVQKMFFFKRIKVVHTILTISAYSTVLCISLCYIGMCIPVPTSVQSVIGKFFKRFPVDMCSTKRVRDIRLPLKCEQAQRYFWLQIASALNLRKIHLIFEESGAISVKNWAAWKEGTRKNFSMRKAYFWTKPKLLSVLKWPYEQNVNWDSHMFPIQLCGNVIYSSTARFILKPKTNQRFLWSKLDQAEGFCHKNRASAASGSAV